MCNCTKNGLPHRYFSNILGNILENLIQETSWLRLELLPKSFPKSLCMGNSYYIETIRFICIANWLVASGQFGICFYSKISLSRPFMPFMQLKRSKQIFVLMGNLLHGLYQSLKILAIN